MSVATVTPERALPSRPTPRWQQQLVAIVRLELRKTFPLRTLLALALLALAPLVVLGLRLLGLLLRDVANPIGDATTSFAGMFETFTLRFVLCLGCAAVFGTIVRREQLDRTLHFYLLSPVRRELVAVGKYLAALIVSVVIFGLSTIASFWLAYAPFERGFASFMFGGPGLGQQLAYLAVTALACAAYGAVFLAFGTLVKNPVLPAIGVLFWEDIHGLLPASLQHLSIAHYLLGLCPIHLQEGVFAIVTEPPSLWLALPVLLGLMIGGVTLAAYRMRGVRIQYEQD